ncbi:hypothetical protein [Paraflavitalea sp. CAU 1676]|uniref:hypothetical protein n=1 Tax=Paraflavitalea sp. CAU 1676 TaxID=3032598 RepID=UPI0023DBEB9E|nr:hypothetical protein [Paraflavitalea sp. CAU 1676]MDF2188132.1 hypothetical protein [Paraflavitalea sp. CAU 1676]
MQEELTKHGRKIFHTMKSSSHTFTEKAKEILIEICIIVFAVSLSIWFHGWSEHRHEQQEVKAFLTGLKEDLAKDIALLEKQKGIIGGLDNNFQSILRIEGPSHAGPFNDSIISRNLVFEIPVTRPAVGRYEGFKSSGKIGSIEDEHLKQTILEYYQQNIPDINYGENYVNSVQVKIIDLAIDRNDATSLTAFASTRRMRSLLMLASQNFQVNIRAYEAAVKKAKDIITFIDQE